MGKYVLVYRGGEIPQIGPARVALMQAWRQWVRGLAGAVIDPGNPFGASAEIGPSGAIGDRGASAIRGYMIFTAADLATATAIASDCPHRTIAGGTIEVHETLPID